MPATKKQLDALAAGRAKLAAMRAEGNAPKRGTGRRATAKAKQVGRVRPRDCTGNQVYYKVKGAPGECCACQQCPNQPCYHLQQTQP